MTREERNEAISTLEYIKEYCHYEYEQTTIDRAIESLKQEPTTKNCESCRYYGSHHEVCNYCYNFSLWTEQEPTTKNDLGVDCISREDVRKAIIDHQYSNGFCEEHNIDHSINTSMALIVLGDLPSVTPQEPRWIPVSERLPDIHNYSEHYFVTLKRGGVYIAMFTECDGKHWWTYDDVIAWMPLPKPYEPQESEDKE